MLKKTPNLSQPVSEDVYPLPRHVNFNTYKYVVNFVQKTCKNNLKINLFIRARVSYDMHNSFYFFVDVY